MFTYERRPMHREQTTYTKENGVAYLTMNRPDKGNAITRKMADELREGTMDARDDPEMKILVFKGAGRFFSPLALTWMSVSRARA
jgi:2-(1,2-epoxy-1,2-dihydrophenyl)acetyl-CoA isomerase